MPVDYSKWDKLELSDDEDFECHPNVDKKSMVRWKQAQVHKQRRERDDQIALLTMEYQQTEKFLLEIPEKMKELKKYDSPKIVEKFIEFGKEAEVIYTDPMRKESMSRMENWPPNWEPPVWCDVLRSHVPWHEALAAVLKDATEYTQAHKDEPGFNLFQVLNDLVEKCLEKFKKRQPVIQKQLQEFDSKIHEKITMDQMKTGFDKTRVLPKKTPPVAPAADKKTTVIETIHTPKQPKVYDGLWEQIQQELAASDEDLKNSHPHLLTYSKKRGFEDMLTMLKAYPDLQNEKNEEVLLMRALCQEICLQKADARNTVLLSLILKYTRTLGATGIDVFFSKLQTGSNAQSMFFSDVENTYEHITNRGNILRAEHVESHNKELQRLEQMKRIYQTFEQDDGTLIYPLSETATEEEKARAEWFNALPEYFKKGLLTEDIDKINEFLSSLSPEDAEKQAKMAIECGFIQVQEEEEDEETAE